ncbi:UNVERIFIED_CONTAM: hypothetical protein K2H54_064066 [Gekko kuhli]
MQKLQLLHPFLRHFEFSNTSTGGGDLGEDTGDLAADLDIVNVMVLPNGSIRNMKIGSIEREASGEIKFAINEEAIVWSRWSKQVESIHQFQL